MRTSICLDVAFTCCEDVKITKKDFPKEWTSSFIRMYRIGLDMFRHVILSTRKMNVEFLVTVSVLFLSYSSREFNHSSVLLFSEVIKSLILIT